MARFQGDLPARTYRFALAVLALVDSIPDGTVGWAIAKQLVRSGTAVGANVREADVALTNREFAHLCNIARREAFESHYWISLAIDHQLLSTEAGTSAMIEADELARILSTVVQRTQIRLADSGEVLHRVPSA